MTDEQKRELVDWLDGYGRDEYKPRVPLRSGEYNTKMRQALRRLVEAFGELQERLENLNRIWTQDFRTKAARSKTYEQMEDDERQGHDDIIEKLRDFDPFKE